MRADGAGVAVAVAAVVARDGVGAPSPAARKVDDKAGHRRELMETRLSWGAAMKRLAAVVDVDVRCPVLVPVLPRSPLIASHGMIRADINETPSAPHCTLAFWV